MQLPAVPLFLVALAAVPPTTVQEQGLPAVDRALRAELTALVRGDAAGDAAEHRAALDRLRARAGGDFEHLVPQLFLFSREATTTREAMAFGVIAEALGIPDGAVARALVPLLEIDDARLHADLAGVLTGFEKREPGRRPSFSAYRDFLAEPMGRGADPPEGLVRYLFAADPGEAMLLLARVARLPLEEERALLLAEHVLADVLWRERYGFRERGPVVGAERLELERLLGHPAWYARLCAAELLVGAPHLGRPADLERLGADPDPRVRRAVERGRAPSER